MSKYFNGFQDYEFQENGFQDHEFRKDGFQRNEFQKVEAGSASFAGFGTGFPSFRFLPGGLCGAGLCRLARQCATLTYTRARAKARVGAANVADNLKENVS